MGKPDPQKRKPIRDKVPLEEITENFRNNAKLIQSKPTKMNDQIDANDDSDQISDDEEESLGENLDLSKTKNMNMNETYKIDNKARNRGRINTRSGNEMSHEDLSPYTDKSRKNTQLKPNINYKPKSYTKLIDYRNKWLKILTGCCACLAVFLMVAMSYGYAINPIYSISEKTVTEVDPVKSVLANVKVTLESMMSKYKNQEKNLWKDAYTGIANIIREPKKPSIIVLLGNKDDPLDCLAVLLGNVSSNALNSGTLLLNPEKFESDTGSVIESLRLSIQNNKAVIIWDLLNINVEALKAFHNLCDRINPLVEEVIYIITIIADDYNKESNPLEFVEKELFKKLSGKIKADAIQPLITRITDGPILAVKPEPTVTDCPLPKVSRKV